MTNQHKGMMLVGLLLAWGGITTYQMWTPSESEHPNFSANMKQGSSLPSIKELSLAQSFPNTRKMVAFSQPRNIFAPIGLRNVVVKPKTITRTQPTTTKTVSTAPPVPPGPSAAELAAQRAREQLNQFRFLGYLTKGGESQAFLTNGQAIYIVKQGETLEGQIQVNKIAPENIILSTQIMETGNQIQATIPLTPEARG